MKYLTGLAIAAVGLGLSTGVANAAWSSVALDMAGNYYLATGAETEEAAKEQALQDCTAETCQAVLATEADCLAVADTPEGNYQYGWAYGATKEGTEMIATGYCIESGFPGCKTLVAICTADVPDEVAGPGPGPGKSKNR